MILSFYFGTTHVLHNAATIVLGFGFVAETVFVRGFVRQCEQCRDCSNVVES